jgi:tRNA1Val (adenine37-N6)-methyltransferase
MQEKPVCALRAGERLEPIAKGVLVLVRDGCTFSTDTILLAWFSMPKNGEMCADFGTGCGAIPLLWCARSHPASVCAAEIQPEICDMARRSVQLNGLEQIISIEECDVRQLSERPGIRRGDFDLVACNPPYQEAGAGVVSAVERERIARHETVCSFSEIAAAAASLLRWGGRFCCCMRPARLCGTLAALHDAGLEPKRLRFVQQRASSAPFLFLLQANRGGRPGMVVEPVLFIEEDGKLSEEMLRIYGDYKEGRT